MADQFQIIEDLYPDRPNMYNLYIPNVQPTYTEEALATPCHAPRLKSVMTPQSSIVPDIDACAACTQILFEPKA